MIGDSLYQSLCNGSRSNRIPQYLMVSPHVGGAAHNALGVILHEPGKKRRAAALL